MITEEAKKFIKNIFSSRYSEDNLRKLIKQIFENVSFLDETALSGSYIKSAFQEHILSYKRIAKYTDENNKTIDILSVCVRNTNKLEHARTMQRNFISNYLNGGRGGKLRDAALVVFYSKENNNQDWRLSLVCMDYVYDEEKNRLKEAFTPARRFSFLLGTSEQIHTACKQFLPLLTGNGKPKLENLEETFNIETVSNEFFEKYKELFLRLCDYVNKIRSEDTGIDHDFIVNKLTTNLFCKKLLGQIVFLYFLQKKGYLGVPKDKLWGEGDKKFLRTIFEKAQNNNKNYFNDYLEHLFYEALAVKQKDDFFELFDCKIPFLNGGLFEPISNYDWEKFDILIPNEIFSNKNPTKEGDTGDGILDVFDRYNFTVKEDEVLEKEVAVDPEMLGKVFENLLEIEDRKSKGAFYTPREIVHYMCQESLINYLYNKLNNITEKSYFENKLLKEEIKKHLEIFIRYGDNFREFEKNKEEHKYSSSSDEIKKYSDTSKVIKQFATEIDSLLTNVLICDPAIGSGAFPIGMMNEVVKARLNLLESGYINNPNENAYTYKRHVIENSLYGVDIDSSAVEIAKLRFWLSLIVDENSTDKIQPLPNLDYKIRCGNSLINIPNTSDIFNDHFPLITKLEKLKQEFINITDGRTKRGLKKQINDIFEQIAKKGNFDFKIFFSEVFEKNKGFDIVIGNPPYVQLQKFKGNPSQQAYKEQKFKTYEPTGDLYCLFYEKGINLLRENGVLAYITSNKWMRAGYGESLREFFIEKNPILLIDLGGNVFPNATVDTNILFVENKKYDKKTYSCEIKNRIQKMSDFVNQKATPIEFTKDTWAILSPIEQSIKAKIEKYGTPLKDWDITINYGIKTGCNEAFIISGEKRKELIAEDPKSDEIIRPILRGRDIKRYGYNFADLYIITTFPSKHYNIDDYPAIKKHLKSFGKRLEQTGEEYIDSNGIKQKCRKKTNNKWFETQDSIAYWDDFSKQKIMYSEIVKTPQFYLDKEGVFFAEATTFIMTGNKLEYLLMALHSKLLTYVFKKFYAGGGLGKTGYRYKKIFLENLPIYQLSDLEFENCKNWLKNNNFIDFNNFLISSYKLNIEEIKFIQKNAS